MSFPRYEEYRDSGVEWLGEVPAHWELPPLYLRYEALLGKMLDEKRIVGKHPLPYLRNIDVQWDCVNVDDLPMMDIAPEEYDRFTVRLGDLLVCEGGEIGRAAIWEGELAECAFQKAIHRLRPIAAGEVVRFLYYCFAFAAANKVFIAGSNPNTIPHLTSEKLRRYRFPRPPENEQRQIAEFLDREVGKLDALIAEQRRLIDLLTEKRQAIISHAVTKGLEPRASMKPSGFEWIGEIPVHWTLQRLKHLTPQVTVGIVVEPSRLYVEDGVPALRSLNVRPGAIDVDNLVFISAESNDRQSKSKVYAGDLVVVRSGQPGTTAIVPPELDGCNCIDLIIIRKPAVCSEWFLCWYLGANSAVAQIASGSGGAIQQHFNIGTAVNLIVPVPPLEEQVEIAAFLTEQIAELDEMSREAERLVVLLQERRAAMISAAVTGKFDVHSILGSEVMAA